MSSEPSPRRAPPVAAARSGPPRADLELGWCPAAGWRARPGDAHSHADSSPPSKHAKGAWLKGVAITEYWPAPESWFVGRMVKAPGLPGLHRVDWLYSATGMSMEGSGIGLDGQTYHIDALGDGGWVTSTGASTSPSDGWSAGAPYWRAGGFWRNKKRAVTFPLGAGGWSNGRGAKYMPLRGVTFAAGSSLPLHYYQSIAVDPTVIPLGSRVYVPAYRNDGYGGWFVAQDTGGAINGHHIDVYRPPPASVLDIGQSLSGERIFVIKPKPELDSRHAQAAANDAGRAAQPAGRDAADGEPQRRGTRGRNQVQGRGPGHSRRPRGRALRRQGRPRPLPAGDRLGATAGAPPAEADGRCVVGAGRAASRRPQARDRAPRGRGAHQPSVARAEIHGPGGAPQERRHPGSRPRRS